jgi:hypothetical protein
VFSNDGLSTGAVLAVVGGYGDNGADAQDLGCPVTAQRRR